MCSAKTGSSLAATGPTATAWRRSTRSSRWRKSISWRSRGASRRSTSGGTRWPPTSGSRATRHNRRCDLLNLQPAHWCHTAADVIGPVDVAFPHRHAVGKRTALGQLNRIHDLPGDHVALEERAHVGVRLPEVFRVGRLDADTMRTIADRREHVLDHPGLGLDPVDHPGWGDGEPEFAVLH